MYEDFLPLVTKPARYINTEINAVQKDISKARTSICLFFPDTYEVGMSHLGLRILYDILNGREDTVCERVFSPWTDYEALLRKAGRPLRSLESNTPVKEFDIIGVTLQYELSYTNIIAGLKLVDIPLRYAERTDDDPVVIAGGPCSVNPEPLSEFIDAFFIGEAEEAVHEIIDLRQRHAGRRAFLEALSRAEGFYVPLLGRDTVRRRVLKSLEAAVIPARPIVPLMKPVHDRLGMEIARGCIRGCRFCQAGIIYRPYRERSPETIKGCIQKSLACTGYEEISLSSLSSGDYSSIQPLIQELMQTYRNDRVSISLPSLRVGTLTPEMIEAIAGTRKTGFTLAPEAGTERLRKVINKPVSEQDLLDAARTIFKNGWSVLKLYFMIGLPTETEEDIDGIIRLCREIYSLGKRTSNRNVQINVGVSSFVPKPHTPFQWMGQTDIEEIRRRQARLEAGLRRRGINLKFHRPEMSLLEAVFARGDSSLSRVISKAVELGCRFDGWTETFDYSKWREAFNSLGIDPEALAKRAFGLDDTLPWDHIKTGVTKEFLMREYKKGLAGEVTENCRVSCEGCGMGCRDGGTPDLGVPKVDAAPSMAVHAEGRENTATQRGDHCLRIRMKYKKTGRMRFISHLDLMTLFQRAAFRANVPVVFSQGFNPHPKISFGPALSVGIESEAEYLDMDTDPFVDITSTVKAMNRTLPEGIRILEARTVSRKARSLSDGIGRILYDVYLPDALAEDLDRRVKQFLDMQEVLVERDGKKKDIRPSVESVTASVSAAGATLTFVLNEKGGVKARIQDVLSKMLNINDNEVAMLRIVRTGQLMQENGGWLAPMTVGN